MRRLLRCTKLPLCMLLVLLATSLFSLSLNPIPASASVIEDPWNARAHISIYRPEMDKRDGIAFEVSVIGAKPGDKVRMTATVADEEGNSISRGIRSLWDDGDLGSLDQGIYYVTFEFNSNEIEDLVPGICWISVDLEYYNDATGSWADCSRHVMDTNFVLTGDYPSQPEPDDPSEPTDPSIPMPGDYADMQDPNDWRYDGVYTVAAAGLITGYGNGYFGVDDQLTTAQLITILYRYAEPEESSDVEYASTLNKTYFIDVADFQFYTPAVNWAFENGVVNGYLTPQGYRLDPNAPVSTERAMTILANYLTKDDPEMSDQEVEGFLMRCVDGASVSEWARPSIAWALKTRMISGYDTANGREIRPWESIPRGRFAVILSNGMATGALPPNTPGIIPE